MHDNLAAMHLLERQEQFETLNRCLQQANAGFGKRGVRGVPRDPNETTRTNPAALTAKEIAVLALLVQDFSNAKLAQRLHRSPQTIDHHVSAIFEKLGVGSRAEAVTAAFALGIVNRPADAAPSLRRI